jgi:hypothetical protein
MAGGVYYAVLDATDTNTYGPLKIFVHVSGALPVILECDVMEANAYDAKYAALGTGYVEANAVQISGDATAADNLESDYDGTGYAKANSTIGTVTTNTDLVTAAAVRTEMDSNSTQLAAIVADTGELQTDDIPGLLAALENLSAADVATELATYDGPTKAEMDAGFAGLSDPTAAAIADAVADEILSGHTTPGSLAQAITDILADSGELQSNQGNWLTATGFSTHAAADIWSVVPRTLTAGTKDAEIDSILGDTGELQTNQGNWLTATGFSTHSAADVQALLNDLDASETAAAVWDALLASYQDVGSMGEALGDAGGAGTPPTVTEIRQEMDSNSTQLAAIVADTNELQTNQGNWLTATGFSTHAAADVWAAVTRTLTAGTKDSEIDSILADTAELQANQSNWLTATGFSTHSAADVWLSAVRTLTSGAPTAIEIRQEMDSNSTQLAAILADTGELQQDNVPGLVAALENLSATEVRAQIVSALSVDTYAEPTAKPGATASITDKLAWLTALARNKVTQSDTTQTLYKDDAVSTISTAPVSQSAGVVTRGEFT